MKDKKSANENPDMKCQTQDWDYQYSDEDINGTDFEDGCDDEDDDDDDNDDDDDDDDEECHLSNHRF